MKILGSTANYEIGQVVTKAKDALNRDYTPIVVGHVIREATEAEFLMNHPHCAENLAKYPDSRSLFTFPHYYAFD